MKFFEGGLLPLAKSVLTHNQPLYVQYYVTARCNLRCEQCNVIYANADQEEATTSQAMQIAENLAEIGTSMVLLTGGEPFIRKDLPEIAKGFVQNGIHPRLQTNGLASDEALRSVVEIGAHDISISLDSLIPTNQDMINGGYSDSWLRAIDRVSFINNNFPKDSFCAFGCVLSPHNFREIPSIIKFASHLGWWVSLVPAHQTSPHTPRSFSTYDPTMVFRPDQYAEVESVLSEVKALKNEGFNIYDSEEYLSDILRFIRREPLDWRRRNGGECDSPNLYFAIQPNGDMAVCCDYRLPERISTFSEDFPRRYQSREPHKLASPSTKACSGCMYGSFPEISVSARYLRPMLHRATLFLKDQTRSLNPLSTEEIVELAKVFQIETK